jgi:Xaa-Pro aminopeptidase
MSILWQIAARSIFLSHAIGTELIESPFLSEKEELLQPGMFFTLEPQMA